MFKEVNMMKKRSLFLFVLIFAAQSLHAAEFPNNLLFSRDDLPRIKKNTTHPFFSEYWQSELKREVEEDANFCRQAFIYLVTGEEKRADYAKRRMLEAVEMKRWDYYVEADTISLGFLRGSRMTAWMSLCYDWLYDHLSPDERKIILNAIAEKGCVPCYRGLYGMRYPDTVIGWGFDAEQNLSFDVPDMSRWPYILGRNNFRAVINGGFALGTATLMGIDDRTDEWFDMLVYSYHRFVEEFKADGSYEEGMSYCNYAMTYLVYMMEVSRRKMGLDLFDAANYMGIMQFNLGLFLPHILEPYGSVNFGDAGNSMSAANGFWIARHARDGLSQYIALNYSDKRDFMSLVWFDETVPPVPPARERYLMRSELDWITTRTGFGLDDLVVAMRSGGPANHEHADRNSVILKQYGEILLSDNKHPTYDRNDPGWFLRTALAHNTVTIDGRGHPYHNGEEGTNESKAAAELIRFGERNGYHYWASDATPAYALMDQDVHSVTRSVFVFHDMPCVVIADKLIKKDTPSSFAARWHIENSDGKGTGHVKDNSFEIKRPNAKLFGYCGGSPDIKISAEMLPLPDSTGVFPYINAAGTAKSKASLIIFVGVPLRNEENVPKIAVADDDNVWSVEVKRNAAKLLMHLHDRGKVPEFSIREY